MMPALIERPSPNHDQRPPGGPVDILLLHYTGMKSGQAALERLCDPAARVGSHYLIDEDGSCYRLVPDERRAWHAGESSWAGARDINARSIGIELVNPGHEFGYRPFPEPQMRALEALGADLLARHAIPSHRVIGHSDVAPLRKRDPGEFFDWARLARAGLGLWPRHEVQPSPHAGALGPGMAGGPVIDLQLALGSFGYGIEATGSYDAGTEAVVTAFQRHYRPGHIDGVADPETQALLYYLLARLPR